MNYEVVIGLEVHAELSTKSKIFCSCSAEFGGDINTHVCPVCSGMPGTLPVLNREVLHYAMKMGLATGCKVNQLCKSDRKNYFYPDLPKAYQISQFDVPICEFGEVRFYVGDELKKVRMTRIHIEEDAGKLVHDSSDDGSLVDFNRCGVPLIEMVTEPDIRSSEEAKEFLETIKTTLSYLDICDCKMEEGSIRCDINVSLRKFGGEYGTRVEMKNVNSFSAAVRAIDYEVARQSKILDEGGTIDQETRRWDDVKGVNQILRSKEDAHDYRYFPDPDLVAIEISDEWLEEVRAEIPVLPIERLDKYTKEYGLGMVEANIIVSSFEKSELLDNSVKLTKSEPKTIANWILSDISKYLNDKNINLSDTKLTAEKLVDLVTLIEKGTISGNAGKKVLVKLFETDDNADKVVEILGLKQVSDEGFLLSVVSEVLANNQKSVDDYIKGNKNVIGFLVGQCMKASKGQGNPQMLNKLISTELEKLI